MSWFRKKKIEMPPENHIGEARSKEALQESEQKLKEARKDRAEIIKVTRKSRELDRKSDFFAEALERAMRRTDDQVN